MSPDWLTAAGTIGTFVVITASAIAALVQLRHMGRSNQIASLDEVRAAMESVEFRKALDFVQYEIPKMVHDPGLFERIRDQRSVTTELTPIRYLANHFEYIGLFVRRGMVDPALACDLWAGIAWRCWETLAPITAAIRENVNPGIWVNFEYLAAISKRYTDSGAGETYPSDVPRLPLPHWDETTHTYK